MANPADKYAQKTFSQLESQMSRMYREAYKDISKKLQDFTRKHKAKDKQMQRDLKKGKITQEQYASWLRGQVFISQQWQDAKASLDLSIKSVMTEAAHLTHQKSIDVFVDNANYTAYQIEKDHGFTGGINFSIYDRKTVSRLMLEDPELLPRRRDIDGNKLEAWNTKVIANCVTQSILQGESIDELSKRIARDTCIDAGRSSLLYARTAMTGAQNAGRVERMKEAEEMGIKVQKQWMSTLDSRTRDSHRGMDGEIVDTDEDFSNGLEYPGDPSGDPSEVYNCRCTLVYHYPEYSNYSNMERTAYIEEGDPAYDESNPHVQWDTVKGMTYNDWLVAKGQQPVEKIDKYAEAMEEVARLKEEIAKKGADKVFSGIWYNQDVTYADWEAKKDSIQAKRDWYNDQIAKEKEAWFQSTGLAGSYQEKDLADLYDALREATSFEEFMKDPRVTSLMDEFEADPLWQEWSSSKLKKFEDRLKLLDEFDQHGAEYSKLLQDLKDAEEKAKGLAPKPKVDPDKYSQSRKDAALWTDDKKEVDSVMREKCGEVWRGASEKEKDAAYEYTRSYSKFNEPLRGIEYGTNAFVGVGNTDLDAGSRRNGELLDALTDLISKSTYDHDQWFQRGVGFGGMDKFFQCDPDLLLRGSQAELESALLGKVVTEHGFMSVGSARGQGFSGSIIMHIYARAATQMLYVEPFSAYGGSGAGRGWNGTSGQSYFGSEFETIIQQGTQFRITRVRKDRSGIIHVDLEVIDQSHQQRWGKKKKK